MIFFFGFAECVNRTRYRKCEDSVFCARNRFIQNSNWTLLAETAQIHENIFSAKIIDEDFNRELNFTASILKCGIPHVRIANIIPDKFPRYDFIKEPTLIDQDFISDLDGLSNSISFNKIIVESTKTKIILTPKPFNFEIYTNGSKVLTMNYDNSAVYEFNMDKKQYPVQNRPARFNDQAETLRNGPTSVGLSFLFHMKNLKFSGLAHHTLNLTLKPTTDDEPIRFFNTDINSYEIGNGMAMYGTIPFLVAHNTTESIGVYWCNPSETWVDISKNSSRFLSETGYIEFFVITGSHREVTHRFADLTGHPAMPQSFALGFHQCRWTYMSSDIIRNITNSLDEYMIPHDSIWLDLDHTDDKKYFMFDNSKYKDIKQVQYELLKNKRKLVTLVDPHLKNADYYFVFSEAKEKGYLVKNSNGGIFYANCWPGNSSWVDFLNPDARKWWASLFSYGKYKDSTGLLFIWNDMNEPSIFDISDLTMPRDALHFGDIEEREVHNLYGHFNVLATADGLISRSRGIPDRPFILTRSFFAGSQKYAAMWTGDNAAEWDHLRNSIPQILSLSICQFPFSGSDVGGFFNSPDKELLCRWYQAGAWTYSFFRCHCHHLADNREPYRLSTGWRELAVDAIIERYQLFPLWYTASRIANLTGEPIVSPLYFYFNDEALQDEELEVLLGESLLVAPIVEQQPKSRKIILPSGVRWYDYRTYQEFTKSYDRTDVSSVPVYIRGGRIILQKLTRRKSIPLMHLDNYTMVVALDDKQESRGELYADDGHSFKFLENEFVHRVFTYKEGILENREHETQKGNLPDYENVYISTIKIVGCHETPSEVVFEGKSMKFSISENVLVLEDVNVPVSKDWSIQFKF
ncbi:Glycosyl hydrolases family 31 protein [Trichomonas vaginalis G3]|uniref:Glucosidase II subunit alpha n=1 Tax=Trichomonas vaginalis (strain ATCC PRA-98 / G3) TaxID=412133 RepID=A2FNG9_TRIV3|nr:glycosyl hydrolase [Trichomonas vaginalis G3]EAX93543.1 Glycosyl hydrolases family 31 protein [Trichomonas vaginalis G3]KAI5503778.1 alpha-glucosidase family [Trichomonas vaginalis G3]|eukprot:XP_001306473.1 glycosyl hydrolase [Trichomonas vaginalis G3]